MHRKIFRIFVLILSFFLLFSLGCKRTVYDITGSWDFDILMDDGNAMADTYSFSGSIESGDVYYNNQRLGEYTVNDRSVNITIQYYDEEDDYTVETFSGYFDDKYSMSGSYTLYIEGSGTFPGIWTAQ